MTRKLTSYQRLSAPKASPSWDIPIEVVTQLYGGGAQARRVDEETPVRPSSIRGQLRFWWRALYGGTYGSPSELYERERALFGGMGKVPDDVHASRVVIEVRDIAPTRKVNEDVTFEDPASYVLWPARGTSRGEPPAERWAAGVRFHLVARIKGDKDLAIDERELKRTLRAWLLFGGIGGRTRRGCGSLGIADEVARNEWLPESLEVGSVGAWLSAGAAANAGYPSLSGSRLCVGSSRSASDAWHEAIGWLRDFRQGFNRARTDTAPSGPFARQRPALGGGNAGRPGRSRWPEPDLIRHEYGAFDHPALIPAKPLSWPRAQFGLPIQFRFQNKDRSRNFFLNRPPPPGELGWSPTGEPGNPIQRLASPLIIKPVQLRSGRFSAVALWLNRTLPEDAIAGVKDRGKLRATAPTSDMPPSPLFTPLAGKASTRDAFMDWLVGNMRLTGGTL